MTPEEAHAFFENLHEKDKATYKSCMQVTASRRKLRSVFLERKPRPERHRWMQSALASRGNEDIATELLQNWLLGHHREMICSFLDDCGIAHSEGLIDDIPAQPDATRLRTAVDNLFAKYPAGTVKLYLQVFQPLDAQAWPDLDDLLQTDPRLTSGANP